MTVFKPVTLSDKELITSYILPSEEQDCDLSFANLCTWQFQTESAYAIIRDRLVVRFAHPEEGHEYFLPIGGEGNLAPVVEELKAAADACGERLCLRGSTPGFREGLEREFPGTFTYTENRDYSDYIYNRADLAGLQGRHYQPKRNHVNKFRREYAAEYVPLTPEHIPACLEFEAAWCAKHGYAESETIRNERRALTEAFRQWEGLGLKGVVILVAGEVVAFTFGAPICHHTFGVHYEKADIAFDGSYAAINQCFAAQLPERYLYLNREEDLGIPGLRQAKLSYHPAILLAKTRAIL